MSDHSTGKWVVVTALIALLGTLAQAGVDFYSIYKTPKEPPAPEVPTEDAKEPPIQQAVMVNEVASVKTTDCTNINGGLRMCWGKARLETANSHVRRFAFKFRKKFARKPVITTAINTDSTGYAYAVYDYRLTEAGYSGSVVEVEFRKNQAPVEFSYIAVGPPAG